MLLTAEVEKELENITKKETACFFLNSKELLFSGISPGSPVV